jgi:hypothetical protein
MVRSVGKTQAVHVAYKKERRGTYWVLERTREGKRLLGRPRLDGRIILKFTLKKQYGEHRLD